MNRSPRISRNSVVAVLALAFLAVAALLTARWLLSGPEERTTTPQRHGVEVAAQPPHVQAVIFYFDKYDEALHTGKVQEYLDLASKDCQSCRQSAERVRELMADGGHLDGPSLRRVEKEPIKSRREGDRAWVAIPYISEPWLETASATSPPIRHSEQIRVMQVKLALHNGEWKIKDIYATR